MNTVIDTYDLYSPFDIKQHVKHYYHYLEVVISPEGIVEYAVPSHQEKLISIAMDKLKINRDELSQMCPPEYYFNFLTWLCNITGYISVWTDGYIKSEYGGISDSQLSALESLKEYGAYEGTV